MRATGKTLEQLLDDLANRSGLLGLSGFNDLRDIEAAAAKGDAKARLALDVFVAAVRHYLGAYLLLLGGADAIVFTGGIGENSVAMREAVCADLDWFGIDLDAAKNATAKGEAPIDAANSRVQLWIMPTNEELIVARQAKAAVERRRAASDRKRGVTMFLAKVTGSVVATQKVASMTGHKLLTVEPLRVDPASRDKLVGTGRTFVGVDTVGAGQGEMVLIVQGSSARLTPETEKLPVDATIIGIVDTVNVENKTIFSARESQARDACRIRDEHHASHRRSDPQRRPGSAGQHAERPAAVAPPTARRAALGRLRRRRRRRRRRRQGAAASSSSAAWTTAEGRRLHPQDLHRAGRGAGPRGARRDEDRPARAQDREADRRRREDARRRVPADRRLQRRERHHARGVRPVRRHRHHHAGDALAADAGRQRHQHARRRQRHRLQPASRAAPASPARACSSSTRRSTRPSASTT